MKYQQYHWKWQPMSIPQPFADQATEKLRQVIQLWENTPYMPGQQVVGVGVDCVRFVCQVFKALHNLPEIPLEKVPADASMHSREGAIRTMRKIMKAYAPIVQVTDGSIEPGDVIIVGYAGGGPGHAMLVGTTKNAIYHADSTGVIRTGLGVVGGQQTVFGVFRKTNRIEWIHADV